MKHLPVSSLCSEGEARSGATEVSGLPFSFSSISDRGRIDVEKGKDQGITSTVISRAGPTAHGRRCFYLYLVAQDLVTWLHLAAREAGKSSLPGGQVPS